jgi:hypothetical protein
VVTSVIAERKAQFEAGYFDRNIERWGGFGNRVVSFTKDFNLVSSRVKETWQEEIDFQETKFKERAEWMLSNPVTSFKFNFDGLFILRELFRMLSFIMLFLALLVWVVVLVLFILEGGCDCEAEETNEEEEIQLMGGISVFGLKTLQMSDSKF